MQIVLKYEEIYRSYFRKLLHITIIEHLYFGFKVTTSIGKFYFAFQKGRLKVML